jgi:hypothetical protein
MKFSIAISILILAIGGATGLMHQKRLTVLRGEQRQLIAKAEKLGIATAPADEPGGTKTSKRPRDLSGTHAGGVAAEMTAFARAIEQHEKSGEDSDEALEIRARELQAKLMKLDASQLKELIAGLRKDQGISGKTRQNLISHAILVLGDEHPEAALALFTESSDLLEDHEVGGGVISSTLGRWAKQDPLAAHEWIRANAAKHPEVVDDDAKRSVITGAAEHDPELAFKLIGEMHLQDAAGAVEALVEAGRTSEQRTAILGALREHLATLPAGEERDALLADSLETMGRSVTNESFESVQSWITTANLAPEERARFAAGLSYFSTKQDTGRWIDWMAGNLPKEEIRENVDNLIGQWTQQDYLAAGKWLSAAADGPAKQAAISTYAETVAEYDPQVAAQWALTLPAGEERQATLEAIHENWPKSDAGGAAAFAKEHGIATEEER